MLFCDVSLLLLLPKSLLLDESVVELVLVLCEELFEFSIFIVAYTSFIY